MNQKTKEEKKKEFFERFKHFNEITDGTIYLEDIWQWIEQLVDEVEREKRNEVKQIIVNYIKSNWHASLGWGEDEETYQHAFEELDWILFPLGITFKDLIKQAKSKS